jgi:release factor glutamine methyltransferase
MTAQTKTVAYVLKTGADYLAAKQVEHPKLACEHLVGRRLGCRRLELGLRQDQVLSEETLQALRDDVKRVATGEPVQYVLGEWDFMGRTFKVDRRALIPRPETEVLVDQVLKCERLWRAERPLVVDVGTGCGCIAISLALARPTACCVATDASEEALALARENAAALGAAESIAFAGADLSDFAEPETVDAIIANLPYVPTAEYERLPAHIRNHEPRQALDGGPDGLRVIDPLVEEAEIALKPNGYLFLEIGARQGATVSERLREAGFDAVAISQDLAGRDRIVSGVRHADD